MIKVFRFSIKSGWRFLEILVALSMAVLIGPSACQMIRNSDPGPAVKAVDKAVETATGWLNSTRIETLEKDIANRRAELETDRATGMATLALLPSGEGNALHAANEDSWAAQQAAIDSLEDDLKLLRADHLATLAKSLSDQKREAADKQRKTVAQMTQLAAAVHVKSTADAAKARQFQAVGAAAEATDKVLEVAAAAGQVARALEKVDGAIAANSFPVAVGATSLPTRETAVRVRQDLQRQQSALVQRLGEAVAARDAAHATALRLLESEANTGSGPVNPADLLGQVR